MQRKVLPPNRMFGNPPRRSSFTAQRCHPACLPVGGCSWEPSCICRKDEQDLAWVIAMATLRIERAVYTVSINLSGSILRNKNVPVIAAATFLSIELNNPVGCSVIGTFKRGQLHSCGAPRIDTKIHA